MQKEYIAIIGDIHDSRLDKNRKETQNALKKCLNQMNTTYTDYIVSPFTISLGDSFQVLLHLNTPFIDMIASIEFCMAPMHLRYGIGIGEIQTDLDRENSQLNDGPAYHRARQTLQWIEENEEKYASPKTNMMLLTDESLTANDQLINSIFSLNTAIKSKWTPRQNEIIKTYLENNENQYDTAEALGIGQSNISRTLKSTNFYTVKNAFDIVSTHMKNRSKGEDDYD